MLIPAITIEPYKTLRSEDLAAVAFQEAVLVISDESYSAMQRSHDALTRIIERGDAVYGVTTGFGPLVRYEAGAPEEQGISLIAHLGAGYGEPCEPEVVRGAMIARLRTLALGMSGIRPEAAKMYASLLKNGIIAAVPSVGSLGASGDLIPLAHIVRVMTGEGEVLHHEENGTFKRVQAAEELRKRGFKPYSLTSRDALALVNGTSFSAAYLALAVVRSARLIRFAEEITAWMMNVMQCRKNGLNPRLHLAKGHRGQTASAHSILSFLSGAGSFGEMPSETNLEELWNIVQERLPEAPERPLQEIYSIRCAPQILGAARDVLRESKRIAEAELNGADDNPLVHAEALEILHGGNFMTQHIAFAADSLNSALTQVGNLAERQIEALMNPAVNGGKPLLLATQAGAQSGMAGVQLTATALLAEMRSHSQHYASASLPSNAGNQDIVPLGFQAAREAYHQTERLAAILVAEALCVAQYAALTGLSIPNPAWMQDFQPLTTDRALREEIEWRTAWMLKRASGLVNGIR